MGMQAERREIKFKIVKEVREGKKNNELKAYLSNNHRCELCELV